MKMHFFYKSNNSLIVNTSKQILHRGDGDIFFTYILCKFVHSGKICFTVSGRAQKVHVDWSSPDSKYEGVRWQ